MWRISKENFFKGTHSLNGIIELKHIAIAGIGTVFKVILLISEYYCIIQRLIIFSMYIILSSFVLLNIILFWFLSLHLPWLMTNSWLAFWHHSYKAWGAKWGIRGWIWVGHLQDKCSSLPPILLKLYKYFLVLKITSYSL